MIKAMMIWCAWTCSGNDKKRTEILKLYEKFQRTFREFYFTVDTRLNAAAFLKF